MAPPPPPRRRQPLLCLRSVLLLVFACASCAVAAGSYLSSSRRSSNVAAEFRSGKLHEGDSAPFLRSANNLTATLDAGRKRKTQEAPDDDDEGEDGSGGDSSSSSSSSSSSVRRYILWQADEIRDALLKWEKHYPDFVRVTTAQEAYGLPAAGAADDCPFDPDVDGCLNYVLTIQDFVAHPEGSESSSKLPEVLWSGEVHGNERVGPTAVMEAAQLLLDAASCEADPRTTGGDNEASMQNALSCRKELEDRGFTDKERRWLARLVSTRRIVVVPTANALGYYRVVRTEEKTDPNRDFPYDLEDFTQCMQTIAGRTLNEVFREHMFQLSLTFHGGMEGACVAQDALPVSATR